MIKFNKKILFIISDLESGGAQRVVSNICNNLIKKNYSIKVLLLSDGKVFYKLNPKIQILHLNLLNESKSFRRKIYNNIQRILKIRKIIIDQNPNSIVSFIHNTNILSIIANLGLKNKIIVSERNNPYIQKTDLYWKVLQTLTYKFCDYIVVNNYFAHKFFKKTYDNVVTINNSLTKFDSIKRKKKNNILIVSRHHHQKNIEIFIKAFSEIHKKFDDWRAIIIGSGVLAEKHKTLSKKLKINSKILWIADIKDIAKYYESSKIFCLPSRYEGFSNSLLEALYFNLDCVVSDSAVAEEDEINEFITKFKCNSHDDLKKKIINAIKYPKIKNKIQKKRFLANFESDKVIDDWEKII